MPARRRQTALEPEVLPVKRSTRARAIKTDKVDLDSNKKETAKEVKNAKTGASNGRKRNAPSSKSASTSKTISTTPKQNVQTNRLRSRSRIGEESEHQPVDTVEKETTSVTKSSTRLPRKTVKRAEQRNGSTDTSRSKGKENTEPVIIGARRKRKLEEPSDGRKNSAVSSRKRNSSRAVLDVDASKGNDSQKNDSKRKRSQPVRKDVDNVEKVDTGQKVTSNPRKRKKSSVATAAEAISSSGKGRSQSKQTSKIVSNLSNSEDDKQGRPRKRPQTKTSQKDPELSKHRKVSRSSLSKSRRNEDSFVKTQSESQLEVSTRQNSQMPIWKRTEIKVQDDFTGGDIYDPCAYTMIEDDQAANKKKKPKKRKKETKAILVFGDKDKNVRQAVKSKHNLQTPPAVIKKVSRKFAQNGKSVCKNPSTTHEPTAGHQMSTDISSGAHNFFDTYQPEEDDCTEGMMTNVDEPVTSRCHGGDQDEEVLPAVPGKSAELMKPSQQDIITSEVIIPSGSGSKITPVIPKAFAKRFQIQKDHVSTPKLADLKKDETVQDMIKNAFGFDSEEDEDDMSGGESIISPVKKMATSFLEVSKPYDSRISIMSFREPDNLRHTSGWRCDLEAHRPNKSRADLIRQIQAMEREKLEQGLAKLKQRRFEKPIGRQQAQNEATTRTSPRKKPLLSDTLTSEPDVLLNLGGGAGTEGEQLVVRGPVEGAGHHEQRDDHDADAEMTAFSDLDDVKTNPAEHDPAPSESSKHAQRNVLNARNAYDVLKAAGSQASRVKKLTKKLPKKAAGALEQSSLLAEDEVSAKINKGGVVRKKIAGKKADSAVKPARASNKMTDKENTSRWSQEQMMPEKAKTYSGNRSKISEKPSVSFNQTSTISPQKKASKKNKKIESWAALQTSHFSEIDEIDISFV